MASSSVLGNILTQQTLTTAFGLLALGLGLFLSLSQGNIIVIGFMALFTALIALVLVSQIRTSIQESQYA